MSRVFKIEKQHSEIVSKGTFFKVLKYLDSKDPETPVLLLDGDKIREKADLIGKGIKGSRVFYAVKAHPAKEVIQLLDELGTGFEIASEGELRVLATLGVSPDRIITSNPMKSYKFLREAAEYGVNYFAFDTTVEVDKMAEMVPGAKVYLRLAVPNEGSEWPLSKKYGAELDNATELLLYARQKGLDPVGITFHVGSQCTNVYNWNNAIYKARQLWDTLAEQGLQLKMLNIGGGYPINYTKSVVGIEAIEKNINKLLEDNFPEGPEIFLEPGRAFVGDAGVFVSLVNGKADRVGERWVYLDVGVFNGLMESVGGIKYSYVLEDRPDMGAKIPFTVSGPSCDSFDVIDKDVYLSEPVVGSRVLVLSAGAYTISYASEFNGFSIPKTIII